MDRICNTLVTPRPVSNVAHAGASCKNHQTNCLALIRGKGYRELERGGVVDKKKGIGIAQCGCLVLLRIHAVLRTLSS